MIYILEHPYLMIDFYRDPSPTSEKGKILSVSSCLLSLCPVFTRISVLGQPHGEALQEWVSRPQVCSDEQGDLCKWNNPFWRALVETHTIVWRQMKAKFVVQNILLSPFTGKYRTPKNEERYAQEKWSQRRQWPRLSQTLDAVH